MAIANVEYVEVDDTNKNNKFLQNRTSNYCMSKFIMVKALDKADEKDLDLADNEYLKKNKMLVRNILKFIAGMTYSYAISEYNKFRR